MDTLRPDQLRANRRGFLRLGAAVAATAGLAGAGLSRLSRPARATVTNGFLELHINEGFKRMVDESLVYARGYGLAATARDAVEPSLSVDPPQLFLAGGAVVEARRFPTAARDTRCGAPDAGPFADVDEETRQIFRRTWASVFPRRTLVAVSGSTVRLEITNHLRDAHTFTIADVVDRTIPPGAKVQVSFAAPPPGVYLYHDTANAPVNRVLGLHGVLVVMAAATGDGAWRLRPNDAPFERQWLWILADWEPEWARRTALGSPVDPVATPAVPRYFTINDRSGVFSLAESPDPAENQRTLRDTKPAGHRRGFEVRDFADPPAPGQLIRIANAGVARHQPHFHGNHVRTLTIDAVRLSRSTPVEVGGEIRFEMWEDVVSVRPLERKDVMLPLKPSPDRTPGVPQREDWNYPMHCHAEMSQTAAGGLYPNGLLTDWVLLDPHATA